MPHSLLVRKLWGSPGWNTKLVPKTQRARRTGRTLHRSRLVDGGLHKQGDLPTRPSPATAKRVGLGRCWENLKRLYGGLPWVQPCILYRRSQKHLTLSSLCAWKQLLAWRGGRNVQGQRNLWEAANFLQPALGQTAVTSSVWTPPMLIDTLFLIPEFNILHKYLQIFRYLCACTLYFKIMDYYIFPKYSILILLHTNTLCWLAY